MPTSTAIASPSTAASSSWPRRPGPNLNTRDLRTDRLLQEALAGGDAKRISEMFGLSIDTVQRCTKILGQPSPA
ncbi:hypothetical protein ACGFNV_03905 [Streptomyces sp. NPDC048751]|uniref:hypothetical protein n=1 Tax=Streptomyces sp. NPDC048751 TaxID=3365591 RepID=UPI003724023A